MAEVADEATYVRHHKAKIALVFSAMRHFAEDLVREGWQVEYQRLDDSGAVTSLGEAVARAAKAHRASRVLVTEPGEWRLRNDMERWSESCGVPVEILEDDRFVVSHDEFSAWAKGRKQWRMEYFYRQARTMTGLLMDGDQPAGGQWNFDAENRKAMPPDCNPPPLPRFEPDAVTREVIALVSKRFGDHFGSLEAFNWPVTRAQALAALDDFIDHRLARFGDYQDAMRHGAPHLFHSLLSPALNLGLLGPMEICRRVEDAYRDGAVPLNAAEGFIRQILGWREYVRGVYWAHMPDYRERNRLDHHRALPDFYWTGDTGMACMADAIGQTERLAYAHHIQRLMVTGNFALLAGIDPAEVHEWYLAVYADAYEWVELPNTLGMSQHADGGIMGSKPYIASGAYINRMSDHCRNCAFNVSHRTEHDACPFNALYWNFIDRHAERLVANPRMSAIVRSWHRMDDAQKARFRARAGDLLAALDAGKSLSPRDFSAVMGEEATGRRHGKTGNDGEQAQGRLFR